MRHIQRRLTRLRRSNAPADRSRRKLVALLLVAAGLLVLFLLLTARLTPIVREMALSAARNDITQVVNDTVSAYLAAGEMDYDRLVHLEKSGSGEVTALVISMSSVNELKAEITYGILSRLEDADKASLAIPLGNLIGGSLFSGHGPSIPVTIVSVGSVETDFANRFSSAGINQTRHEIVVRVSVTASLLVPGSSMETTVTTEIAVAETIIVGSVPDSYTYFEADEKWDESLEQFDILT